MLIGQFKKVKMTQRIHFLNNLIKMITLIMIFTVFRTGPIWGNDFYKALVNSKMGLNLSRGLPTKHYTSNRIASLMGNGLLTLLIKTELNDMFNKNEIVMYENIHDLTNKINFIKTIF